MEIQGLWTIVLSDGENPDAVAIQAHVCGFGVGDLLPRSASETGNCPRRGAAIGCGAGLAHARRVLVHDFLPLGPLVRDFVATKQSAAPPLSDGKPSIHHIVEASLALPARLDMFHAVTSLVRGLVRVGTWVGMEPSLRLAAPFALYRAPLLELIPNNNLSREESVVEASQTNIVIHWTAMPCGERLLTPPHRDRL